MKIHRIPSRSDLQTLTKQRLDEASALLSLSFPDAAFYLAGYSIECALKAVVCKTLDQDDFYKPDRSNKGNRYVQDRIFREFKTHNYNDLLVLSGLSTKFELARVSDPQLYSAWIDIQKAGWTEQYCYELGTKSRQNVSDFIKAVATVITWISNYW